jgi:signal peptidase I
LVPSEPAQPAPIIGCIARAATLSKGFVRDLLEIVGLAIVLYIVATLAVQTVHVVGLSMYPTLNNGDLLIASKLDYRLHQPERGDIVIMKDPMDPSRDFIKRVIGLPGDRISIRNGHVYVNQVQLEEPYVDGSWRTDGTAPVDPTEARKVPADSYFVLGDNRDHSSDSRFFGYVNRTQIEGKALVRFWPFQKADLLNVRPSLAKER